MKDFLKIALVVLSAPVWLPFARALWEEFVAAMRQDGGFEGPTPTPQQRREIQEEIERSEPPRVVIEPLAHVMKGHAVHQQEEGKGSPAAAPSGGPKRFRT